MSEKFEEAIEEGYDAESASYTSTLPAGVLSVHIKKLQNLHIDEELFPSQDVQIYIRIKVGDIAKCSKTVDAQENAKIVFDDLKHFSIVISRKRIDPSNIIKFDIVAFEGSGRHQVIGRKEMHLYDVIKSQFMAGSYDLKIRSTFVASLEMELCFAYGIFGYGHSHQLENRQRSVSDTVGHSLLYRVEPPNDRKQGNAQVMSALPVGRPAEFVGFEEEVEIGNASRDLGSVGSTLEPFSDVPVVKPVMISKVMKRRLERLQTEYRRQTTRQQRIGFLQKIVLKHADQHVDEDVLLGQLDEGAEKELLSVPPTDFRESLLEDEPSGHDLATMALFLQNAPGLSMRLPGEGRRPRMMNIPEDDSETSLTSKVSHESAASAEVEIKEVEKEQAGLEETQEDRRRSTLGALPGTGFISSLMSKLRVKRQLKKQSTGPTAPDAPQAVPTFSLQQATPETSHHSIYSLTHFTSKADEAARDKEKKDEDGTAV